MPRTPKLEPVADGDRWRIDLGPTLSSTGKRERLWFATKEQADTELRAVKLRASYGAARLSPTEAIEAHAAFKLLEPTGVRLLDAVRQFVEIHKQRNTSITFNALFREYLAARSDLSGDYKVALRSTQTRLSGLANVLVADINPNDLRPFLDGLTPAARNANLRHLRAVFAYGVRRQYLTEDPAHRIDFVRVRKKETEIFSPEQIMRMLDYTLVNDLHLLPYFIFCTFCGVRADGEGEIVKLEWRDVNLDEKHVTLRPEITKINRRRTIDLADNAVEWIRAYQRMGGRTEGRCVRYLDTVLDDHRKKAMRAAGISKWIQAGLRHSFCSYFLANGGSIDALVIQSGHDGNAGTMFRHYHRTATKADAKEFWSILPPSV